MGRLTEPLLHHSSPLSDEYDSWIGWESYFNLTIEPDSWQETVFHDWTVRDSDNELLHRYCMASIPSYDSGAEMIVTARILYAIFTGGETHIVVISNGEGRSKRLFDRVRLRLRSRAFFREETKKVRKMTRFIDCGDHGSVTFISKNEHDLSHAMYKDQVIIDDAHMMKAHTADFEKIRMLMSRRTQLLMIGRSGLEKNLDPMGIIKHTGSDMEGISWIVY